MSTTTIVSNSATILQESGRMVLTILSSNTAAGVLAEKTQQALDAIDSAADTAMFTAGMYPDTALGLAGTVDGEYFSVPSPEADEFSILYQNVAGSAVEKKRFGTAAMSQAAIDAAAAAAVSEAAAADSEAAAAGSAALADADRIAAETARDATYSAAQSSGVYIYNAKSEATAAVAGLPDLSIVEVLADESQSGARTRYRKESGSLVFKIALDEFLQAGVGAVARTVSAKLREVGKSPQDYGAVADGVTDDATKLQAWLTANAGKVLTLAPGTYKCNSGLTVPADTWIIGYGATIDFSTNHVTGLLFTNGGGVDGVKLLGKGNASYNASGRAIACLGTSNSPAAPTYVKAPIVRRCNIDGWGSYGVYLKYCTDGGADRCTIKNIGYAAVSGLSCSRCYADYNYIDSVSPGTSSNAYGIAWSRANDSTEAADPRSYDCTANDNIISGVTIWEALDTHGGERISFCRNRITGCKFGVAIVGSSIASVESLAAKNCVVSNNVIAGSDDGPAIKVVGAVDGSTIMEYVDGCIVSGNVITGGGDAGVSISGSILFYITKGVSVTGNTIRRPSVSGINAYNSNIGFNVSGNVVVDPFDNTFTAPSCVLVPAGDNKGFIGGNTFVYENASLGTYVSRYSIRVASGYTGNDIVVGKNNIVGIDATHLQFSGVATTGANFFGAHTEQGTASVSITSGGSTAILDVTFAERFPSTPRVRLSLVDPVNGGGKVPVVSVSTKSDTGFRIVMRPYDLSTFSATGSVSVDWEAST
jgi:hypothetical protein